MMRLTSPVLRSPSPVPTRSLSFIALEARSPHVSGDAWLRNNGGLSARLRGSRAAARQRWKLFVSNLMGINAPPDTSPRKPPRLTGPCPTVFWPQNGCDRTGSSRLVCCINVRNGDVADCLIWSRLAQIALRKSHSAPSLIASCYQTELIPNSPPPPITFAHLDHEIRLQ